VTALRPHYPRAERMAILELRASRGWSLEQTANVFLATAETISSWVRRIDETGTEALVQTFEPVNRFPELVRYLVQRLKTLCPSLGKQKIVQVFCRAGLKWVRPPSAEFSRKPLIASRRGRRRKPQPRPLRN
jgi:hypothetical protein